MKILTTSKEGGPDSNVTAFWLIEWKRFFSIALLRFNHGTRDAFHSHAFNCVSWLLKGELREHGMYNMIALHRPGLKPIVTKRTTLHKVFSNGTSWVLTFRGPWQKTWNEHKEGKFVTLTNGRKIVE